MNEMYEALEKCLQEIEQGADIDTVLFRYPDLADELRPILEASRNASSLAVPAPAPEVVRRNRARVLQHAAQLRESKVRSTRRAWFVSFRRLAVTLAVVGILFASGTGLVRAASTTLPGDQLYPVKRTWEDVVVLLTFNMQQREALEVEQENERIQELHELFTTKRSEEVEFVGLVTLQNGNDWVVSGIPIVVSTQTEIHDQGIMVGSAIKVKGHTQDNGAVLAEEIKLLPPNAKVPDMDHEQEIEDKNREGQDQQIQDNSGDTETPKIEERETPAAGSEGKDSSLKDGSSREGESESGAGGNSHDGGGDSGSDDSGGSDSGESNDG